jgi:hypothetical protein
MVDILDIICLGRLGKPRNISFRTVNVLAEGQTEHFKRHVCSVAAKTTQPVKRPVVDFISRSNIFVTFQRYPQNIVENDVNSPRTFP